MYFVVFGVAVLLDRISKLLVMQNMELYENIPLLPHVLNLCYITNKGAAFSIFEGKIVLLILLTLCALAFLWWLWRFGRNEGPLFRMGIILIVSGAIGNLIDRVFYGEVIDFLQFAFWPQFPVFNIADVCIVVAAGLIIIDLFMKKEEKNECGN